MTGGASFCEVFLTDVALSDDLRLGEIGAGWTVALTVLGFERSTSAAQHDVGGSPGQATALARWLGRNDDPLVRQALARLHTHDRVRVRDGSLGKLAWTQGMTEIAGTVSTLLGPRLVADTGEWGTYAWTAHVLGAPGYRIAGGSDEIQKNIIGERVLGLPREPRSQES
jgi:alkylation response protein AidB-like acyl-CoA dehydrogenase